MYGACVRYVGVFLQNTVLSVFMSVSEINKNEVFCGMGKIYTEYMRTIAYLHNCIVLYVEIVT